MSDITKYFHFGQSFIDMTIKKYENEPQIIVKALVGSKIDQLENLIEWWDELPEGYKDYYMNKEKLEQRLEDWRIVYNKVRND